MPLAAHAFGSSKKDCMHQKRVTVLGVWHLVELTGDGLDGFSTRLSLLLSLFPILSNPIRSNSTQSIPNPNNLFDVSRSEWYKTVLILGAARREGGEGI